MDEIEQSLAENGKIGEDEFCSHPEAEVKLDLTDDTPVYRPQYEIPKALHPIVDEQIETWLKKRKIEAASPLTCWNSSSLMVPKMDLGQVITTSAAGSNFFLVVTDVCTRFTIVRALPNKAVLTVARELYKIVADFGLPKVIQSDNGAEFVNTVIREMKEQLGFQHRTISAYHPQANGAAEVNVGMAKRMLKKFTHGDLSCWCLYLPAVQLSMNVRVTKRHHSTPFSLIFNRPANIYEDYSGTESKPLTIDEMIRRNDLMTHLLFPAIGAATDSHKNQLVEDFKISHRILADGYPKGALVMKVVDIGRW